MAGDKASIGEEEMPRFSDQELMQLSREFYRHREEAEKQWVMLVGLIEKNTEATERLAESIGIVAKNTEGVVALYASWQGATRVGVGVQSFLTWLVKLGAAGAAVAAGIIWILNKFGGPGP